MWESIRNWWNKFMEFMASGAPEENPNFNFDPDMPINM